MKRAAAIVLYAILLLFTAVTTAPASAEAATTHIILATQGWQNTGVSVAEHSRFRITYAGGTWTVDHRNFGYVGPEGYGADVDSRIYKPCRPYTQHPYGYLMGTISNEQRSYELHVGQGGDWMAAIPGTLYLRINDDDRCLGDNDGAVTVTITQY
jgi:hypothetical protein